MQHRIDGGAMALCQVRCPSAAAGGECEHQCAAAWRPELWATSHMHEMQRIAALVLNAQPFIGRKENAGSHADHRGKRA